jgi:antitoxin (DNA-binding transcriptional repressor) of toxin-antitoxin stability system
MESDVQYQRVPIFYLRSKLAEVIDAAQRGVITVVTEHGKPTAILQAVPEGLPPEVLMKPKFKPELIAIPRPAELVRPAGSARTAPQKPSSSSSSPAVRKGSSGPDSRKTNRRHTARA